MPWITAYVTSTLKQHQDAIEDNVDFFEHIPDNDVNYKNRLAEVISIAESIVSCSYEPEINEAEELSLWDKIKRIFSFARTTLRS